MQRRLPARVRDRLDAFPAAAQRDVAPDARPVDQQPRRVADRLQAAQTLGQRGGLAIGGVRGREAGPWYVVGKDVASNTLTIDQGVDSPFLMSMRLLSEPAHWVAGAAPGRTFDCTAQTRYRQPDQACHVQIRGDGSLEVSFVEPQRAVTPGQSVVLYRGEECLGGAVIAATDAPLEKARFETLLQQER